MANKQKLFQITGTFLVELIIVADSKDEAIAWSNEQFTDYVVVNPDNNHFVLNSKKVLLKLKKPKKLSLAVEDALNGNL
jgi:hypothetical protein